MESEEVPTDTAPVDLENLENLENLEIKDKQDDQNLDSRMETEITQEIENESDDTLTDISDIPDFVGELNPNLIPDTEEKISFASLKSEKNPFAYMSLFLELFETLNECEIMTACDRALYLILTLIVARQPFLVTVYLKFLDKLIGYKCIMHCKKFICAEYITFYLKSLDLVVSEISDLEPIAKKFPGENFEQVFLLSSPFEKVKIIVNIHQRNNFFLNLNSESWYISIREILGNIRTLKEFRELTRTKIMGMSVIRGFKLDFFIHLINAYVRIGAKVQLSSIILQEDQIFLKQLPLHNQKKGEISRLTKYREIFQSDELMAEIITRFEQFLNF